MNPVPIRVLHLEDDPDYSDLVRCSLEQDGIAAELEVVTTAEEFALALEGRAFDIILADYLLPHANGLDALEVARVKAPETPFLLVSGTIGEQAAIQSVRAGATDYVLKHLPGRLVPSIRRAIEEAAEKRERRRIQEEFARREQYYRTLTENALDVLITMSREATLLWCSPSVERVLGYAADSLPGTTASEWVHPEDQSKLMEGLQQALADPALLVRIDLRVRHRDGTWRYLEALGQNRLDDPELGAILVTLRDITQRKLAEANLGESERRFRELFEASPDAIFVTDTTGAVLDVNPAACELHHLTREELTKLSITDLVPPDQVESVRKSFRDLTVGELRRVEGHSRGANGKSVPVEVHANPIEYRGKAAMLLHVRDISERILLEDQLRQAQKMEAIGQLAGGVAHDFNNILTVIHGHASLLQSGPALDEASARSAQQISQAAERAAALTRQLLAFSRRQVMQVRVLDMNEVVCNMTKMLGRILGEDIALQLSYCPGQALVNADAGMMEQVLLNLAVNSRDAMPKGGLLKIRISIREFGSGELAGKPEVRPGPFVCVSVSDTGCGILPENLRRIFEPFFTTKEVGKGTGLGLATVYGIARQHHGWVEVASTIHRGSTFTLFLPMTATPAPKVEEAASAAAVRGGKETILVVEDEGPVRDLVCTVLQGHGYRILQAASGPEAIGVWKKNKTAINLLLTDMVMPDRMSGGELARRLCTERPDLKVLFTSGYSSEGVGQEVLRNPRLNYLQKPYHPLRLASAVRDCLDVSN
jgi:PAS domain S-box-containing protein